jgi:hypothetical protein
MTVPLNKLLTNKHGKSSLWRQLDKYSAVTADQSYDADKVTVLKMSALSMADESETNAWLAAK